MCGGVRVGGACERTASRGSALLPLGLVFCIPLSRLRQSVLQHHVSQPPSPLLPSGRRTLKQRLDLVSHMLITDKFKVVDQKQVRRGLPAKA